MKSDLDKKFKQEYENEIFLGYESGAVGIVKIWLSSNGVSQKLEN